MKLLSDPFQGDPTDAAVSTEWNSLTFRMTLTWRQLLVNKICWALTAVMFHQTVTPICRRTPGISLLCLVEPTAASNCFREWKTQKWNQGLCLQMNILIASLFRLLLLEQYNYLCKQKQCQIHTKQNWSALAYNLFCVKRYCMLFCVL